MIEEHLIKINKPAIKTIQSPDGDIIDCVLTHLQPAFDHPQLKGQKPLDPPERPKGHNSTRDLPKNFQLWSSEGESCPNGTIPIRRTKKEDILRASSIREFGIKLAASQLVHEYAYGEERGGQYNGAKAVINIWTPKVVGPGEFSLSQIWVVADGGDNNDLNTIECGWQVFPQIYGDYNTRLFVYWTRDGYKSTGCYNLVCSGFVQTNKNVVIGGTIQPVSSYDGSQAERTFMIWKDQKTGNWWLEFDEITVGYWPSNLFTHLKDSSANVVQFGGEIVNGGSSSHTSTEMGSGHFSSEGYKKSSYFKDLRVVDLNNALVSLSNFNMIAGHPDCYDIQGGIDNASGNYYFYYGGPGRNSKCP